MSNRHQKLYRSTLDRLGRSVDWTVQGQDPVTIEKAVFDAPIVDIAMGDDSAFRTVAPVLKLLAADLPQGAAKGDVVTIDGQAYYAGPLVPNGLGWLAVPLEAA